MKVFQWTGFAPLDVYREGSTRRENVSCAVACPSAAAFIRLTGTGRGFLAYVSADDADRRVYNELGEAAKADPGTVYWIDSVRHTPGERVILPYSGDPARSCG